MAKVLNYSSIILLKKHSKQVDLLRSLKFIVPSQNATVSPPLGPVLGQYGINIMDFCKQFNERSKNIDLDVLVLVDLKLFKNKNFVFIINKPPVSFLVNETNFFVVDDFIPKFVDLTSLYKIVQIKAKTVSEVHKKSCFFSILGTLRSMHIKICNDVI